MKTQITTEEEFDAMVDYCAGLAGTIKAKEAELEDAIDAYRREFEFDFATTEADLKARVDDLHAYAKSNQEALFGKKKSRKTNASIATLRAKATAVKLEDGVTADDLIELFGEEGRTDFLTIKTSLDKTAIRKAMEADRVIAEQLGEDGVVLEKGSSLVVKAL